MLIREGSLRNHRRDDMHIYDVRHFTARLFCLYSYWIKSLWRTDSCPAAELQLHSKQKRLPPPTNKHYLNFKTSRGQGEFINVFIQLNCKKKELWLLFKTFTESSYIRSPVLKWSNFANKHIFSACSSPWTTLHDIVHRESENKYRLISCNLSRDSGDVFFKREIQPVLWWGRSTGIICDKPLWLDRFAWNLN